MKLATVVPVSNLDALPVVLTLTEVATVYRLSPSTIRRQLQQGIFHPQPWDRYPYRWRREEVIADLKRVRPVKPRRPHGFASTMGKPRAAKATLPAPPAARSSRR